MIPKVLHHVWLSNDPLPELITRFQTSWKKHLPGYEFILWDRSKADNIQSQWLEEAISHGKYAFATDFIRIYALSQYGGIYLDADVELLGNFDQFLHHDFFIGFEYSNNLEPAVFGAVAGHPLLKELLSYYQDRPFIKTDGKPDIRPLPYIFNDAAAKQGFKANGQKQMLEKDGIAIYPCDIFSPKNYYFKKIRITTDTIAIHHFDASWVKRNFSYYLKRLFHQALFILGGKGLHDTIIRKTREIRNQQK